MERNKQAREEELWREQEDLYQRLIAYTNSDYYPFHMPGHKRADLDFGNPYKIDITEIDGFDNLHHAEEILLKSQQRLSKIYQSKKAYYLVNGSSCGLLSAIGALTKRKDSVIIARNCHKSVYNAVKIFGLKVNYIYPEIMECGIQGKIDPNEVENALIKYQYTKLVVITSPTYDGIVSDIRKIAAITNKYNAYLIIDEAHGAHFSLSEYFPQSSIQQGADIVIQSLHKTLPSFTQTAVIHIASERVDCNKVEEMLSIFQSSSPSYILMASIERCVKIIESSKKQLFDQYYKKIAHFYKECEKLQYLHVLTAKDYTAYEIFDVDKSKILICTLDTPINGKELYEKLQYKYHLQLEMYSAEYVLAMTSIMDTQEGFDRLLNALFELDSGFHAIEKKERDSKLFLERAYGPRKKALEISEIDDYNKEETRLCECIGKTCGEFIYLYPPGIPMIVPGEIISKEFVQILEESRQIGLNVQGTKDIQYRKILTIANSKENKIK